MKVSIILTCLNDTNTDTAVKSVLNQEFKDFELLIIGGKTTFSDKRIRIIDFHDKHFGRINNIGICKASGDYLTFLESGNTMMPQMLMRMYELCQNQHLDYIKSDFLANDKYQFITKHKKYGIFNDYELSKVTTNPFYRSGLYNRIFLIQNNIYFSEGDSKERQIYIFNYKTQFCANSAYFLNESLFEFQYNPAPRTENYLKNLVAEMEYLLIFFYNRKIRYEHVFYVSIWNLFCYEICRLIRKNNKLSYSVLCEITKIKTLFNIRFNDSPELYGRTGLIYDKRYLLLLNSTKRFVAYLGEQENA